MREAENLPIERRLEQSSELVEVIREEGRRTRMTIWFVGLIFFGPALAVMAPVVGVIVGGFLVIAFVGAFFGKMVSRRKSRRILTEISEPEGLGKFEQSGAEMRVK